MNFGFTEEQELLRRQVRKLLDERCPVDETRRLAETPEGHSHELWKQLGELGFLGLAIPEAYGGAGLGWVDLVLLLEETGRTLLPSPLISTALAASLILDAGSEAQKRRLLPDIADGSRVAALALPEPVIEPAPHVAHFSARRDGAGFVLEGEQRCVPDAASADLLVVAFRSGGGAQEISLALLEAGAAGISLEALAPIDRSKRLATLRCTGVRVAPDALLGAPGAAAPVVARALDRGAAAVTAEMIGAAEAALALTVQYARDRIQFGSPIGRFQGVKHPLAEMYVDIESLKSLLYYAAWAIEKAPAEVPRAVSEAKAFGSLAFSRIGVDCVQLHGAVGYTQAYDIQLYLRRSKWARPIFGDEDHHFDRLAALGGYTLGGT